MVKKEDFSKYERSRIIGARGLQVSMDAPILLKLTEKELEEMNYDPLKIAEKELESGVLPISISKPLPRRRDEDLGKIKIEESKMSDAEKIKTEREETKEMEKTANEAEGIEPKEDSAEEEEEEMGESPIQEETDDE